MPVTEIATLKLLRPWDAAETQGFFAAVSAQQAAWSGCPLHYFRQTATSPDPSTTVVYILTGWESVDAHGEWIRSEQNRRLLERGKGLVEVVGLEHARFAAKLEDVKFVVLERWAESGEGYEERIECESTGRGKPIVDETGGVEEVPGQVRRLRGFVHEPEVSLKTRGEVVRMERLSLREEGGEAA
ncbi:hypothetical protein C8Q77DRAFT_511144 [Trametes polyzona]|nr:hypothetical protein C8Q77DRAFT_511144 [Trametes polyzona]